MNFENYVCVYHFFLIGGNCSAKNRYLLFSSLSNLYVKYEFNNPLTTIFYSIHTNCVNYSRIG